MSCNWVVYRVWCAQ